MPILTSPEQQQLQQPETEDNPDDKCEELGIVCHLEDDSLWRMVRIVVDGR